MKNQYKSKFIRQEKTISDTLILWIPSVNDTFYHQEQLDLGLFQDYDIYLLHLGDYHPSDPENESIPPAHATENFYSYFKELDQQIESLQENHNYKFFYIYSFSTGCLLTVEYSKFGKYRNFIKKIIFDDPYWNFKYQTTPGPINLYYPDLYRYFQTTMYKSIGS